MARQLLASPQPLAPISRKWGITFDPDSPLRWGSAEFRKENAVREVTVLIDQVQKLGEDGLPPTQPGSIDSAEDRKAVLEEAKGIAIELAQKLQAPNKGILTCLGYRNYPAIDLVSEVPDGYSVPRTLRQVLKLGRAGLDKAILAWQTRWLKRVQGSIERAGGHGRHMTMNYHPQTDPRQRTNPVPEEYQLDQIESLRRRDQMLSSPLPKGEVECPSHPQLEHHFDRKLIEAEEKLQSHVSPD